MSDDFLSITELNRYIERNPFNRWLGLSALESGYGKVLLVSRWRDEFVSNQEAGYAHGGIVSGLIAMAGSLAMATRLRRPVSNIDLFVDFHKPAMPGDLKVEGSVVRLGRMFGTAEARLLDAQGRLVASGRGSYVTAEKAA